MKARDWVWLWQRALSSNQGGSGHPDRAGRRHNGFAVDPDESRSREQGIRLISPVVRIETILLRPRPGHDLRGRSEVIRLNLNQNKTIAAADGLTLQVLGPGRPHITLLSLPLRKDCCINSIGLIRYSTFGASIGASGPAEL